MDGERASASFEKFVSVIKALRTPGTGCPWDLEQDHKSLRPYLVEEAYEVLDAIDRDDDLAMREELGDLLLQVVLHAQIADDRGAFSITEVIDGIEKKMVRRHPHVFGTAAVKDSSEVLLKWHEIKAAESTAKGEDASAAASKARLPEALPALQRAQRLGEKAAKAGLPNTTMDDVRVKFTDFERGVASEERPTIERALGSLLLDLCQLARGLGISAEDCLRACNRQFIEAFEEPRTQ